MKPFDRKLHFSIIITNPPTQFSSVSLQSRPHFINPTIRKTQKQNQTFNWRDKLTKQKWLCNICGRLKDLFLDWYKTSVLWLRRSAICAKITKCRFSLQEHDIPVRGSSQRFMLLNLISLTEWNEISRYN